MSEQEQPIKRKRGRPPGTKNPPGWKRGPDKKKRRKKETDLTDAINSPKNQGIFIAPKDRKKKEGAKKRTVKTITREAENFVLSLNPEQKAEVQKQRKAEARALKEKPLKKLSAAAPPIAPKPEPLVMETMDQDTVSMGSPSLTVKPEDRIRLKYDPANPTCRRSLPHIFGFKWYPWAKAFFESKNKMNLLCAANQISKSSTQIRKCIEWATNTKKWPELWPGRRPKIFWYMYPSNPVLKVEFEKKWIEEFLPRGGFEKDEHFGYVVERTKKEIKAIHFFSGVTVYFKVYSQGAENLQTATVDAIFTDEELPEEIYDEVKARLFASNGYFHMVFTATLNQDIWRRALEGEGDYELFPDAFKLQVSMYDCLYYTDGSPSAWTKERIQEISSECKSEIEVRRRVLGKFVNESGRKYPTFDATKHFIKPLQIPDNWDWYVGADVGSGGGDGHPSALCYIAVRPDKQLGYVVDGWRGDGQTTVAGDVLEKHVEIRPKTLFARQVYDWQSKDFKTIAGRIGEPVGCWEMANKGHSEGESTINTLFRNGMIYIFDTAELRKLGGELSSLMKKTAKTYAKDDFADAFRYASMAIPWDFTAISKDFNHQAVEEKALVEAKPLSEEDCLKQQIEERRGTGTRKKASEWAEFEDDIQEWNEAYGT